VVKALNTWCAFKYTWQFFK